MPYELAVIPIEAALRTVLVANSALTTLLSVKPPSRGGGPAIYGEADAIQGALMPYLSIGAWTQIADNRLTPDGVGYGWNTTCLIKAVGQKALVPFSGEVPEMSLKAIMSAVFAVLYQGRRVTVSGYGSAWCDEFNLQPTLKEVVGGVTTFQVPAILRVKAYD